jgi:hypothetical protein
MSITNTNKQELSYPHILISSDGYSISTAVFASYDEAYKMMEDGYKACTPNEHFDDWKDMSYLSDDEATMYANGDDVYLWRIVDIKHFKTIGNDLVVKSETGCLRAMPATDPNYPGIFVEFIADDDKGQHPSRPTVLMEETKDDGPRALIWSEKNNEDYSVEIDFK